MTFDATFDPYFDGTPDVPAPAQGAPRYMHDLVDRAAAILRARWPATVGYFSLWADGEERQYVARMEWPADQPGPRVLVFDGRSGDYVCRSLPAEDELTTLDLSFLDTTAYPHDLVDKQLHEERQAGRG